MATQYWVGADANWNTAANWASTSGGSDATGPPAIGDPVIFDGGDVTACTCDVAISCASLTVTSGYSGKLDFADSAYGHTIAGDATFDGTGEVDCGTATITCSGNWDNRDQTTWTRGTSTIVLTGNTKTITGHVNLILYNLTIETGAIIELSANTTTLLMVYGNCNVKGTFTLSDILRITSTNGKLNVSGTLNGTSSLQLQDLMHLETMTGTYAITTGVTRNVYIDIPGAATLGGAWTFAPAVAGTTLYCAATGVYTFTGPVQFTDSGLSYSVATQGASFVFQGNLSFTQTGTLTWTKDSGTITFDGTNNQTVTTPAGWTQILEDIVINKGNTTAKVTLAGDVYTDSFTGTQGRLDTNGYDIYSDGNVSAATATGFSFHNGTDANMDGSVIDIDGGTLTLSGTAGTHLAINDLDFNLAAGVTGSATYCDVTNSNCVYVTSEIDADDGTNTNSGGNTGWDFVAAAAGKNRMLGEYLIAG